MKHLHTKIKHHIREKKNRYIASLISLVLFFAAVGSAFFFTKNSDPHISELAFTEHSTLGLGAGSVVPASCELGVDHGATQSCWDGSVISICGTCPGIPPSDCAGVPGGGAVVDYCGVCNGGVTGPNSCDEADASGYFTDQCCTTACGGGRCGSNTRTCANGGLSGPIDCPIDCLGVPNGSAIVDACGVCNGDGSSCVPVDCFGTPWGTAVVDACGVCGGDGSTCSGCKVFDACGVCNGNGSTCAGCDGVPNSGKVLDACGVCGGNGSTCSGIWTFPSCPSSCGQSASTQWQVCSGGGCAGSPSSRTCPATSPCVPDIDCVGGWVDNGICSVSSCGQSGSNGQTYVITVNKSGNGASCPFANGATRATGGAACSTGMCPPTVSVTLNNTTDLYISNYPNNNARIRWDGTSGTSPDSCTIPTGNWSNVAATAPPFKYTGSLALTDEFRTGGSFNYGYSCTNGGGTTPANARVTVCDQMTPVLHPGNICLPAPTAGLSFVSGNYTPNAVVRVSCTNSSLYKLKKNGVTVDSGVIPEAVTVYAKNVNISSEGDYTLECDYVSTDGYLFDAFSANTLKYKTKPPEPVVTLMANPVSISRGSASVISWIVMFPNSVQVPPRTPACVLTAAPVCTGVCTAAQNAASTTVNAILRNDNTDSVDPKGSRKINPTAVNTLPASQDPEDWRATGRKTINLEKSMDFKLKCGGIGTQSSSTVRVIVTSSNEG